VSWIRLDDQIAHHPKILSCTPGACWLYVTCIGYAQKFLTNGFIPSLSIPTISHLRTPEKAVKQLVNAGLLEKVDGGWQIHDYLHFNDSKEEAIERKSHLSQVRSDAGKLGASQRWQNSKTDSKLLDGNDGKARIAPSHPIPSDPKISNLKNKLMSEVVAAAGSTSTTFPATAGNGNGQSESRSKRPIFTGQRLTVFEWMLDDCSRTLGLHTEAFDLHQWFFDLDAFAVKTGQVIPKRDGGNWLQAQLVAEARRRGLPFATIPAQAVSDIGRQNIENAKGAIARIQGRK
jgi:hypothetical protein